MVYSAACEYGIRALAQLARRPDGEYTPLRELAHATRVPGPFLAKVFQELVSAGILASARGPRGGYALARPASAITLRDIKAAIDGVKDLDWCAVGLGPCSDDVPCPLHDGFKPLRQRIKRYLDRTTLAEMALALERKRALVDVAGRPEGRG